MEKMKCPIINATIGDVSIPLLIDSGSEISCLQEKFYLNNKNKFGHYEILPIVKTSVVTATGRKTQINKHQLLINIKLENDSEIQVVMLVVPNLVAYGIIGIDMMYSRNVILDFNLKTMVYDNEDSYRSTLKFSGLADKEFVNIKKCNNTNVEEMETTVEEKIESVLENLIQNSTNGTDLIRLENVLRMYKEVFEEKPGLMQGYEHIIRVTDETPYKLRTYTIKPTILTEVKNEIDRMLSMGIIEKSNSAYVNPLVVVIKKDKSVRLCLDARRLNERTIPEYDAPPNIEEIMNHCCGTKYISTFDLKSSFWQIKLHNHSKKYTAFQFMGITYHFNVVPFGLKNSLSALVRALNIVLPQTPTSNVRHYVDDILIHSNSMDDHINHIKFTLKQLAQYGMTINIEKSVLLKKEIPFLGHILSTTGIKKDPSKIEAIELFQKPKNIKQLRSFLGLTNFYSKYADKYRDTCRPLYQLEKKDVKWKWGEEEQIAFDNVKVLLSREVELTHPNYNQEFYLQTDASDSATGAHLYQLNEDGCVCTLGYASKTMQSSEINYTVTEKELLAIVHAVKKFYTTIAGYSTTVRTDHKALIFLNMCKNPTPRITRWLLYLQPLGLKYEYVKGKDNKIADALSRNPSMTNQTINNEKHFDINLLGTDVSEVMKKLKKYQETDEIYQKMCSELVGENDKNNNNYAIFDGILYKLVNKLWLIVLPKGIVKSLVEAIHINYGHIGIQKTYKLLSERFTMKRLRTIVKQIVRLCDSCQRNKSSPTANAEAQFILANGPFDIISIDHIGPFPTGQRGMKYSLVCIDNFTKYTWIFTVRSANTRQSINCIKKIMIQSNRKPNKILSDNGTAFKSKSWAAFLIENKIQPIFTAIRHPKSNLAERANRDIITYIRILVNENQKSWVSKISEIQNIINTTYHSTIEMTPHEAVFNEKPLRPWDKIFKQQNKEIKLTREELDQLIKERIRKKGEERLRKENNGTKVTRFKVDDWVMVKALNISNAEESKAAKLMPRFEGPYKIVRKIGQTSYIIGETHGDKIRGMFHAELLKYYFKE